MFNLLLDALPTEYEGYLIRTDYRIGIQISQALEDEELEPYERIGIALSLLYGNGIPPADIAYEGLRWYLNAAADVPQNEEDAVSVEDDGIRYFSFDYDAARLYSGFRRAYGVELDRVDMHWFRFLSLLGDLGECAFTRVVDIRSADLSKMDKKTKRACAAMRRKVALPQPKSREEEEFLQKLQGGEREEGEMEWQQDMTAVSASIQNSTAMALTKA